MTSRTRCRFMLVACLGLVIPRTYFGQDGAPTGTPLLLSNITQVVSSDANRLTNAPIQACVQGTVVYVSPVTRRIYLQEEAEGRGLQVNLIGPVTSFHAGQRLEAKGTVAPGLPHPRLVEASVRVLGEAALPPAVPVSPHELAKGAHPFQFVSLTATVRDMVTGTGGWLLLANYEGLLFEINMPTPQEPLPIDWYDAVIQAKGIAYTFYDARGHPSGFRFHASQKDFLRVIASGTTNLFNRPLFTIAEASRLPEGWNPRIRIIGTVLVHRPGSSLFLEDGTGVMKVELLPLLYRGDAPWPPGREGQTWLQPGERVEVVGLRHNWFSTTPTLIHAEYRRLGRGPMPTARPVTIDDLIDGRYAGQLVTLTAKLLDHREWAVVTTLHQSLMLQADGHIFQALCESELPGEWKLQADSYVQISGVNDTETGNFKNRPTFELLLRSPADVILTAAPPYWARPEMRKSLLTAGVVGAVALAWILIQRFHLRRLEARVAARTADLRDANERLHCEVLARENAEKETRVALEAERELNQLKSSFVSMVSHEFRTPLEIILSSSHILDRYLERLTEQTRRDQLKAIRVSVHRMSDLMEDVLTLGKFEAARVTCSPMPLELVSFCRRCMDEIDSATGSVCPIHLTITNVQGDAAADEGLLGHILTNLLSNAVKYSTPGSPVNFSIKRHGQQAQFEISDSGCGIPLQDQPRLFTAFYRAGNVGQIPGSGLGLVIVKRCVMLHGGSIRCVSAPGRGTCFTVVLPLFGPDAIAPPAVDSDQPFTPLPT